MEAKLKAFQCKARHCSIDCKVLQCGLPDVNIDASWICRKVWCNSLRFRRAALIVIINWSIKSLWHDSIHPLNAGKPRRGCKKSCIFNSSRFDLKQQEIIVSRLIPMLLHKIASNKPIPSRWCLLHFYFSIRCWILVFTENL